MSAIGDKASLRQTKLFRPPLTEDHIRRVRLCTWLEQIVQRPLPLSDWRARHQKEFSQ